AGSSAMTKSRSWDLDLGYHIVKVLVDAIFAIASAVVLAALLTTSTVAQTPSAGQGDGTSATGNTVSSGSQAAQNAWRGRMLIGTRVLNDHGVWIATIDDILITDDGMVDRIVLSVARRRLVAVPFSQFRFVPSQSIPTPVRGREPLRSWTRIAANARGHF